MDAMDEDDFFGGQTQGGAQDPLVDNEYARIEQKYSDVSWARCALQLTPGRIPRGHHGRQAVDPARGLRPELCDMCPSLEAHGADAGRCECAPVARDAGVGRR